MHKIVRDYIEAAPPEHRALFERIYDLIVADHPDAEIGLSYNMPVFRQGRRRLYVGAWKHGVSLYGWRHDDGGFGERHPELRHGRGTIRLQPDTAAAIPDDDFRALFDAALDD
ncbi:MAG TPA: DUF1801 domain-containing protein [Nocardioides sp.]|jgi:uncharacterized protein YdhG (YjbR/CyaY superfamily)